MGFIVHMLPFLLLALIVIHQTHYSCEDVPTAGGATGNDVPASDTAKPDQHGVVRPLSDGNQLRAESKHDISVSPIPFSPFFHPPLRDEFWSFFLHNRTMSRSDNVTESPAPSINTTSSKQEEDMPAFEEWRQQKLLVVEKEKTENPDNNTATKKRQRPIKNTNYASALCGAKVVAHNPEAENAGGILNSHPDEYMLNSCKAKKYFIVELCEAIHVHGFDIGNLELFSNVPKVIQVSGSGRFPTRDWNDLGRYEMKDSRTSQNFLVSQRTGFVKFIRVEILEHYGKEHYCPISLFKVYGTSMVEEYVASVNDDEDDDDDDDGSTSRELSEMDDAFVERDKWGNEAGSKAGFGNGLTEFVVSLVKKVSSSGYQLLKGGGRNSTPVPCRNGTGIEPSSRSPVNASGPSMSINSPLVRLCFNQTRPWNSVRATCHYVWTLLQAVNATISFCPEHQRLPDDKLQSPAFAFPSTEVFECEEGTLPLPLVHLPVAQNHHETASETALPVGPVAEYVPIPSNSVTAEMTKPVHEPLPVDQAPVDVGAQKSSENMPSYSKKNGENITVNTAVPVSPPVNATPGQKESVFVRMGNRLKVLELNTSLSGQYLHELSRRFKKQGEDSAKNFTMLFGKMSELANTQAEQHVELKNQFHQLEARNVVLEQMLDDSRGKIWLLSLLFPVLLFITVCFLTVVFIVGLYFFRRYANRIIVCEVRRAILLHYQNGRNGHTQYSRSVSELFELPKKKQRRRASESNLDVLTLPD